MILGIVLHILFASFLTTTLWFFALGGMNAWFYGGPKGWIDRPKGFVVMLLLGALLGLASYVYRDHDFIARTPENAARFQVARLVFKTAIPLFVIYLLWALIT